MKNLKSFFSERDIDNLIRFMTNDKKNNSNKINLILLKDIGKPTINKTFSPKEIKKFFLSELVNI